MNPADLATLRDNIKKLVDTSAFMPKKLREILLVKIDQTKSRENLLKIKSKLERYSLIEDSIIKQVLAKDPLFFKKLKHEFVHKRLEKKLAMELQLHNKEIDAVEKELQNLLTA